jgi:hypothetical protein
MGALMLAAQGRPPRQLSDAEHRALVQAQIAAAAAGKPMHAPWYRSKPGDSRSSSPTQADRFPGAGPSKSTIAGTEQVRLLHPQSRAACSVPEMVHALQSL